MKKYPHIIFKLNKKLDQEMASYFLVQAKPEKAGIDFGQEIFGSHPALKKFNTKAKIENYVDEFYESHKAELENSKKDFQTTWDKVEPDFFKAADRIFSNLTWADGKYEDYISILPIGPRFIDSKTFQTCWLWQKNLIGQVIHEMLHFQFYNALGYDEEPDDDEIWHLSEIFNDIIQNEPELASIQGYAPKIMYPEHEKVFEKYKTIWQETHSVQDFALKALPEIKRDFSK